MPPPSTLTHCTLKVRLSGPQSRRQLYMACSHIRKKTTIKRYHIVKTRTSKRVKRQIPSQTFILKVILGGRSFLQQLVGCLSSPLGVPSAVRGLSPPCLRVLQLCTHPRPCDQKTSVLALWGFWPLGLWLSSLESGPNSELKKGFSEPRAMERGLNRQTLQNPRVSLCEANWKSLSFKT